MNAIRSITKVGVSLEVGVSPGLAMYLRVDRFRLECALDDAQTDNKRLIFPDRNLDAEPGPYACPPTFTNNALAAVSTLQIPISNGVEASLCAGI
jgi:hypothetical protein